MEVKKIRKIGLYAVATRQNEGQHIDGRSQDKPVPSKASSKVV